MNKAQCDAIAKTYREAAEGTARYRANTMPGDWNEQTILRSQEAMLRAHARAYEAAALHARD